MPTFCKSRPVKPLDQFIIPFSGLKSGIHNYDLQIDKTFFEHFKHGEIRSGNLSVQINLEKEDRMLAFLFSIAGEVTVPCDRCNELIQVPLFGEERLIVKFGDEFSEQSDEVQIIPESESKFDTAPFLYEFIHLLLPIRRIHPEDEKSDSACAQAVMDKIEELAQKPKEDPRWEKLKELGMRNDSL